ncbi:MAG: phospholipase [Verrucomicrobia bacterium]|nr:MAG: phospholipase [Verrucomicrobiota bacterium]
MLSTVAGLAAEPGPAEAGHFHFEKKTAVDLPYLLQLPKAYQSDSARRWPLVVFLHGSGQRGDDLAGVTLFGPPKLAKEGRDFPFVILSPQCARNQHWQNDVLLGLIDRVVASRNIDTNRIYLTGLSMGGYGTWYLGMKHPGRFAALSPVCGGGRVLDVVLADDREAELKKMPVWAFHGAKDTLIPPSETEQMVGALRRIGNTSVKHTVYRGVGHESWLLAYDDPEFYEWLLAQTREGRFSTK